MLGCLHLELFDQPENQERALGYIKGQKFIVPESLTVIENRNKAALGHHSRDLIVLRGREIGEVRVPLGK